MGGWTGLRGSRRDWFPVRAGQSGRQSFSSANASCFPSHHGGMKPFRYQRPEQESGGSQYHPESRRRIAYCRPSSVTLSAIVFNTSDKARPE